ncbi:hypothetical protein CPB86DRAFT_291203 [Serendipita vermifera]|nr:hypothetical protein CPB86DRAFT_291203 [Serendipita vermifera]
MPLSDRFINPLVPFRSKAQVSPPVHLHSVLLLPRPESLFDRHKAPKSAPRTLHLVTSLTLRTLPLSQRFNLGRLAYRVCQETFSWSRLYLTCGWSSGEQWALFIGLRSPSNEGQCRWVSSASAHRSGFLSANRCCQLPLFVRSIFRSASY